MTPFALEIVRKGKIDVQAQFFLGFLSRLRIPLPVLSSVKERRKECAVM